MTLESRKWLQFTESSPQPEGGNRAIATNPWNFQNHFSCYVYVTYNELQPFCPFQKIVQQQVTIICNPENISWLRPCKEVSLVRITAFRFCREALRKRTKTFCMISYRYDEISARSCMQWNYYTFHFATQPLQLYAGRGGWKRSPFNSQKITRIPLLFHPSTV